MSEDVLKKHLLELLDGHSVYCGVEKAIKDIPFAYWGKQRKNVPYTLFELLEHMRLANRDILEYMTSPDYKMGDWPEDYWPKNKKPKNQDEVDLCIKELQSDLKTIRKLLRKGSLLEPLLYGKKSHTAAREIMIIANHLAYHMGQFLMMRRLLGIW